MCCRPVKGDPIEFDDNLHAFHAVKDLALRKPGTYIDGIPARAMTQVSVSKDAHHVMVSRPLRCSHSQAPRVYNVQGDCKCPLNHACG